MGAFLVAFPATYSTGFWFGVSGIGKLGLKLTPVADKPYLFGVLY